MNMPISKTNPENDATVEQLRRVSAGLLYPSESDEPFEPFIWNATETDALKQIGAEGNKTAPVVETSVEHFFAELVAGDEGEKFKRLREVLESQLTGLRVFRIGEIEVGIYLIGITKNGNWAGLRTLSVET
jgi:hypothetical protein